ncbi:unnamed protein product [Schistosoma margrebowiei]|uniref:Uncharacterized protein n=1 Tax=Schistosoma margrebowiei TaxID=48269 RepID=A0A183LTN5_9TREM|nr:unnamed protein product [Schistosoma margrebowiei]
MIAWFVTIVRDVTISVRLAHSYKRFYFLSEFQSIPDDNTNCSDVQLCQDVDNQLQICLTEELKSLHSYSETPPNYLHYSPQLNAATHPAHTVSNQISVIGSKDQTSNSTVVQDDNFVADIELISLTSQRHSIPRYRLRVDPCTAFLGYRNKDFISARRITRDFSNKYPLPKSSSELTTIGYISSYTTNTLNRTTELNSEEDRSEGEDENDDTLSLTTEQIENTLDYFSKQIFFDLFAQVIND